MKLSINIRPTKVEAHTKSALDSKIFYGSNYHYSIGGSRSGLSYSGRTTFDGKTIRVVNYHKVRKVVQRKRNKQNKSVSKVVKGNHWIGYVYDFPLDFLKMMKVKEIKQNSRNFTLVK